MGSMTYWQRSPLCPPTIWCNALQCHIGFSLTVDSVTVVKTGKKKSKLHVMLFWTLSKPSQREKQKRGCIEQVDVYIVPDAIYFIFLMKISLKFVALHIWKHQFFYYEEETAWVDLLQMWQWGDVLMTRCSCLVFFVCLFVFYGAMQPIHTVHP